MPFSERNCTVGADEAGRVDRVVQRMAGGSRAEARGLIDHQCVTRNGAPVESAAEPVQAGDEVALRWDTARRYRERPRRQEGGRGFQIVFEDRHLLVVDKAAWLLTVPTDEGRSSGTLLDAVWGHVSKDRRRDRRPWVVHRLDRGTSGLLVFARSKSVGMALQDQLRAHKPLREYRAIVAGVVGPDRGTFRSALATSTSLRRYATTEQGLGKDAVTHYEVVSRFPDATSVRVTLESGRRHQIRVHFSDAGHPVLGDDRYRPALAAHGAWKARRLALHAAVLAFTHPVTGQELRFEAPLPPEMERFLSAGPGPRKRSPIRGDGHRTTKPRRR